MLIPGTLAISSGCMLKSKLEFNGLGGSVIYSGLMTSFGTGKSKCMNIAIRIIDKINTFLNNPKCAKLLNSATFEGICKALSDSPQILGRKLRFWKDF